jgi:uncharacterized tellurite resistance protein B-like protein
VDAELRKKICRLIAGLVVADDDLAPEEDAFIDRLLAGFEIPAGDRDLIFPIIDRAEAAAEMRGMEPEVQQQALGMLVDAAVVDGKVVDEERAYLHAVGEAVGVTAEALDRQIAAALAKPRG